MDKLLAKIGWAAGDPHHAHLLTLEREDPAGSAAVEDEDEIDKKDPIVNEDDRLDDDDLDDRPIRGRRTDKQAKAYDELKSERDRLRAERDKQDRLLEDLNTRLRQVETTRESREDTNRRADEEQELVKARSRALIEKIKSIAEDDPQRGTKVYEAMESHNEAIRKQERDLLLTHIDQRSQQVFEDRLRAKEVFAEAKRITIAELEEQGLGAECFDLVEALAKAKGRTDPGWFKQIPDEDQIPELVKSLKERLMSGKRSSQAFKDEKRRHREDQDGVLSDTATTKRRMIQDDEDGESDSPGSMLADLKRWRSGQRRDTSRMLGRRDDR